LRPQRARCACHDETCACVGIASRGPSEQNESAPPPQRGHRADMLYRLLGTTSGHSGYSLWVQGNHMVDNSTIVAGIEIPSSDPLFLTVVIAIHIPLGLACVTAGATAMFSKKGRGRHSTFGKTYFWCLLALFVSATLLSLMRWAENYHLFVLGAMSFASAW